MTSAISWPSRVAISYVFDYFIIVVFIVGFGALDKADPFHQRFSLTNINIQYPYALHERVPVWLAGVICCAFPLVFIIMWTLFIDGIFSHSNTPATRYGAGRRGRTIKEKLWEMNCGVLGLGLSIAAAICITGALKNATGKPRPDLISRCKPVVGSHDAIGYGLSTSAICTGDPRVIRDGFKSWPSGHASVAFSGLGYLSIWLCGKLHVMDHRGEVWKTVLILIPMVSAALVGISRIMDSRHHAFDVLSSSVLGVFLAWLAYRQYFPPLSETWKKGRAHPIRSWATEAVPPPVVGAADTYVQAPAEEDGQAGFPPEPVSKSRIATGADVDINVMERRRQYLEEQESLASRRRQAHGYFSLLGPLGADPQGRQNHPDQRAGDAHVDDSSDDGDAFEMQNTRGGGAGLPKDIETAAYQGYRPRVRQETQSPPITTSSQDAEDRRLGIAQATNAITGGHSQVGVTRENNGLRRVELQ